MAFVSVMKAARYPGVIAKFAKQTQFLDAAEVEANGAASWAKRPGGVRGGLARIKVNPAAIPGVKAMNPGGKIR